MQPQRPDHPADATRLMQAAAGGRADAAEALFPLLYDQLKAIARQRMAGEKAGHTLQATALVHEAYARLVHEQGEDWKSRAQFFFAAARAMQQILVEHARSRGRIKRGGDRERVHLNVLDLAEEADETEILALDSALRRLEGQDERAAQIVRLRFFAGLSVEDTASALGMSERTVKREWSFARAWLFDALKAEQGG